MLPHGSVVWVDDAHGAGVLGDRLRGTVEHVCAIRLQGARTDSIHHVEQGVRELRRGDPWPDLAPGKVYSTATGWSPAAVRCRRCARRRRRLRLLLRTRPGLAKRLQRNTVFVKDTLRKSGLAIDASVFPVVSLNCPAPKEATCASAPALGQRHLSVLHPLPIRQGRRVLPVRHFQRAHPRATGEIGRGTLPIKKAADDRRLFIEKLRFVYRPFRRLSSSLLTLPSLFVSMKRM